MYEKNYYLIYGKIIIYQRFFFVKLQIIVQLWNITISMIDDFIVFFSHNLDKKNTLRRKKT